MIDFLANNQSDFTIFIVISNFLILSNYANLH